MSRPAEVGKRSTDAHFFLSRPLATILNDERPVHATPEQLSQRVAPSVPVSSVGARSRETQLVSKVDSLSGSDPVGGYFLALGSRLLRIVLYYKRVVAPFQSRGRLGPPRARRG